MPTFELLQGGREIRYRIRWILLRVPGDPYAYETALLNASIARRLPACQLGFCSDRQAGVVLMVDLTAVTLSAAIERSRGVVFGLIGRAHLEPPEGGALLAEPSWSSE